MLTWHSDAFSRSTFSLFKKRPSRLLDQQRQNVKKSSFENHDIYTPRAGRGDDLLLRRRPFYTKGKKARALCTKVVSTKPIFFFWKKTHKKNLCLFESLNNPMIDLGYQYLEALLREREEIDTHSWFHQNIERL